MTTVDRREFSLGLLMAFAYSKASFAFFPHGASSIGSQIALNRAYDLGVSSTDNISNYPKPQFILTVDSGIEAYVSGVTTGADIILTANGSAFITHSPLTVAEYNAAGFSQSATALSSGSSSIAGSIDGQPMSGFTYLLDTSITTPTIGGTTPNVLPTQPSYTITFGASPPVSGDILVLRVNGVANASKTLGSGDLSSTSISAVGLVVGRYSVDCYVYSPTGDNKFSQVSSEFSQLVTNGQSYAYIDNQQTNGTGNALSKYVDLGSPSGTFLIVVALFCQNSVNATGVTVDGTSLTNHDLTTVVNGYGMDVFSGTYSSGGKHTVSVSFPSGVDDNRGFEVWIMEGLFTNSANQTASSSGGPAAINVAASDILIALTPSGAGTFAGSSVAPDSQQGTNLLGANWFIATTNASFQVKDGVAGSSSMIAASYR